jgi:hypothetical protein
MKIEDVLAHYRPPFTRVMSGYVMDEDMATFATASVIMLVMPLTRSPSSSQMRSIRKQRRC